MKILAPAVFLSLFALCNRGAAVVMLGPGSVLPGQPYIDYATQFSNSVVAIKRIGLTTSTITYASGVQIDERHILTAAHVMDSTTGIRPVGTISIVTGTNYNNPEQTLKLARYAVHNSYVVGSGLGTNNQIDLAILELDTNLVGRGVEIAPEGVLNGTAVQCAGFGRFAVSGGPLQDQDGYMRAFISTSAGQLTLPYYFFTTTSGMSSNPLNGYGAPRDSGGGVFHDGRLIGIMVAATTGTSSSGSTTYLDLTRKDILSWIGDFRMNSFGGARGFHVSSAFIIPASSSKGPSFSGKINGGPGGKSVRIEVSRDLGLFDPWFSLGAITLDNSGYGEFTNIEDPRPSSVAATSFYLRIAASP